MGSSQYVGMVTWLATKTSELKDAKELWDAGQQADAGAAVATKLAEIVAGLAAGAATAGIIEGLQKTGLDRVFDSLRKDKKFEDYLKGQQNGRNISDFLAGEGTDKIIEILRDWVRDERILDPVFDALRGQRPNEIRAKTSSASAIPSPIVLDLDGDGVETTSVAQGTYFDHAGEGFAERTGWVGSDDGLLVRDLNGNGQIDSGRELFGSETLAQARVQSIATGYANSSYIDPQGNQHRQVGSYTTRTGQTRTATDIWVKTDPMLSIATEWLSEGICISRLATHFKSSKSAPRSGDSFFARSYLV